MKEKVTVDYLVDGLVQRKTHRGRQIHVHIHDDPGPHKRGYVRVGRVEYLYASIIKIKKRGSRRGAA